MQKIINGIAIFSGVVALGVVGLGGYVFIRKDAIIEDLKEKAMGQLGSALTPALPDMVGDSLPDVTGGPIPLEMPKF
tara:strand:+ start:605 stop:835 length:231 start_codon:yes stop_codon:yes gene_type:complete